MELEQTAEQQHLGAVVGAVVARQHELGDDVAELRKDHALLAQEVANIKAQFLVVDTKLDNILGILTTFKNIGTATKWGAGVCGFITAVYAVMHLIH